MRFNPPPGVERTEPDPAEREHASSARLVLIAWIWFESVAAAVGVMYLAVSQPPTTALLVTVGSLVLVAACAIGASAELAKYGDAAGGLLLGLAMGPFGWGIARSRRKQLDRRAAETGATPPSA